MAIYILRTAFNDGISSVPFLWPLLKALPWLFLLWAAKFFFSGVTNKSERTMHGKVALVTGGTSGVGEATVRDLATKGTQIVLLTQHALNDPFLVDFIEDMRQDTKNELITAEQVDLESLHSIRTFATKWIDNAPPRRLDMIILCGNTLTPSSKGLQSTSEGIELNWQVNYLANFHFLSIMSPALRAQPPDRDVRVLFGNCSSYMGGDLLQVTQKAQSAAGKAKPKKAASTDAVAPTKFSHGNAYATSKLALVTFALAFQKHLVTYKRPDGFPANIKVLLVDPGYCRTPGMRRWLTGGSLFGLFVYLITYPLWWLILKSPDMGAQSFLYAAMEEKFSRADGGLLIKECKQRDFIRTDVLDESKQKMLWEYSEQMVQEAEKRGAVDRAKAKKEQEDNKEEAQAEEEIKKYKDNIGKKEKKDGSRRSKKTG